MPVIKIPLQAPGLEAFDLIVLCECFACRDYNKGMQDIKYKRSISLLEITSRSSQ